MLFLLLISDDFSFFVFNFSSLVLAFISLFIINKIENFNYLALPSCPPHFYYLSQSMKVTLKKKFEYSAMEIRGKLSATIYIL